MNLADVIATLPTPPAPAPVSTYRSLDCLITDRCRLARRLRRTTGDQALFLANRIDALDGQIARARTRKQAR